MTKKQWFLFVMRERWVLVGRLADQQPMDPLFCRLDHCAVVRTWGTTKGLGELRDGPTASTKLDPEGDGVEINVGDVMRKIPCSPEGHKEWEKWASA